MRETRAVSDASWLGLAEASTLSRVPVTERSANGAAPRFWPRVGLDRFRFEIEEQESATRPVPLVLAFLSSHVGTRELASRSFRSGGKRQPDERHGGQVLLVQGGSDDHSTVALGFVGCSVRAAGLLRMCGALVIWRLFGGNRRKVGQTVATGSSNRVASSQWLRQTVIRPLASAGRMS